MNIGVTISLDPATLAVLKEFASPNQTQPQWATEALAALQRLEIVVAQIDDQLKQLKTDLDGVKADLGTAGTGITGLQTSITALNATIKDLQTQLANAGLNATQQQALTDAVTEADGLKASADTLAAQFPPATS